MPNVVELASALEALGRLPDASIDLAYIDPPFGTGHRMESHGMSYDDDAAGHGKWLRAHLVELHRVLMPSGTLYLHLDWRALRRAWDACDSIFGANNFLNEVVWSYDYGGRPRDRWPRKHDHILVYAKEVGKHLFNVDQVPRLPYKAPSMQRVRRTPEEAASRIAMGKVPTDVWDVPVLAPAARERTGYPTQKPVALVERAVLASSPTGGLVVDCFAGSGTTGAAALRHGRRFHLIDSNPQAIDVMMTRFRGIDVDWRTQ